MTATIRRTLATLFAATLGMAAPLAAHAQIPGALDSGYVVITNSNLLTVTVNAAGANSTQISGTIQNTTANTFRCGTPGLDIDRDEVEYPGQVTEATIVARSMTFYSQNIFQPVGAFPLDITLPAGSALNALDFGSMLDYFPTGSWIEPLGKTRAEYMNIQAEQDAARIKGHTGDPRVGSNTAFNVSGGGTVSWTAALGTPASGIRTDFDAAAMFYCRNTTGSPQLHYVFAGYETGTTPPTT